MVEVIEQHRSGLLLERRDPSAATTPVVYQSPGHQQIVRWDAQRALSFGFYANTFVYRCIQCISQDVSGLPIRVGADPDRPMDFDTKNPLAKLLGPPPSGPNITTSARQLIAWSVAQYLATGRWGWELEVDRGDQPVGLWPLPSPYLKPIPSESGARYFSRFEFGRYGEEKKLPADRVFYHWKPRQDDWRQPESVLDAARYDISVAVMQDRYDHAFLRNDARPAAVVVYEGFETDAEDESFRRRWNADFQGPDNAGKVNFVEASRENADQTVAGAIDVKVLGLSQKDARSIERYDAKLRAICVAFGVPLTRLGDASGRTFANASEETTVYWQGLLPLLADIQDAFSMKLAPLFGSNVCWFDLSKVEPLRRKTDPVTAQVGAPSMVQAQLMWINEARADYGLPPVPDGDRMMTAEEIQALRLGQVPGEPAAREAEPAEVRAPEASDTDLPVLEARQEPAPVAAPAVPDLEARAKHRRAIAVATSTTHLNVLEATWQRVFRRLFNMQERETLRRLNGKRGRQSLREQRADPDAIFDRNHWEQVTAQEATDLVESVFASGAGRVAADFGIDFDLDAPYVQQFITERANKLAGQVTDTTYGQITDALAEGAAAGETIPEIAERVRHVFQIADQLRSETIARTEVVSAYNGSAATVAAQLPGDVVGGQEWIAVEDARTRPRHAAADGEVVRVGEPFVGTGEPMAYPGDPNASAENIVNCRCTVAFLTPEEMDERAWKVETRSALAILSMVRPGDYDELAVRRALREVRAA